MTTLMRLRRLVRQRAGVPTVDDFFPDDVIDDAINQAIDTIEAEQRWPWQEHLDDVTITPDEPDIPLDDRWRATRTLVCNSIELELVAPGDLLDWTGAAPTAQPQVWTAMADRIVVAPPPAGEITLAHYWYSQPTSLQNDTAVPEMPAQFTGSIVAKAAELLANRESNPAAAADNLADYNQWLNRMRRDLRRTTGPLRIRVRPGGWL